MLVLLLSLLLLLVVRLGLRVGTAGKVEVEGVEGDGWVGDMGVEGVRLVGEGSEWDIVGLVRVLVRVWARVWV